MVARFNDHQLNRLVDRALAANFDLAVAWFQLTEAWNQLELLKAQVDTNAKVLRAIENRFELGLTRSVDILRQRQLLESIREQSAAVESRIQVLKHRLAVLLGRPHRPAAVASIRREMPALTPLPATGLPTELIRRRPDVRSAYHDLEAADRDLAAAISNRYSRLTLNASLLTSEDNARDLFDGWAHSVAGNLLAPLFDAGRRSAAVDRRAAVRNQRLFAYGRAVLTALQEVEDALIQEEKPQLKAARARVAAARAAVAQAELELARTRTRIQAPFDAHILSRNVNLGSQVSPGDDLGRLVGLDTYWGEASVPLSILRWLSFPQEAGAQGARVRIRDRSAWPAGQHRQGRLYKFVGALEDRTRMARVLVTVDDPLGYHAKGADVPPLIIGAFVEARIQAREIPDVVRLQRDYVRMGDTVWVMQDGALDIRQVRVVFRDAAYAYIDSGLGDSDRVVTINLATVVDGVRLHTRSTDAAGTEPRDPGTERRHTGTGGRNAGPDERFRTAGG